MQSPKKRQKLQNGAAPKRASEIRVDSPRMIAPKSPQKNLPIWQAKEQLVKELQANQTLILIGETGSGKTTQLPQFVLDTGMGEGGVVACTQPRRVAAISVATRVAKERGVTLGRQVGYSIRFDDKTSAETVLKYMTDGMLLREALLDPLLTRYKVIILDEAHERTVQTDILFSLIKAAQVKRGHDLRLVVMSATLDAAKFVDYFPGSKAAHLQGRQHPVELFYTEVAEQSYVDAALMTVLQIHRAEQPGDVLVFLTGQDEIESMRELVLERAKQVKGAAGAEKLEVVTIYAKLNPQQQMMVFQSSPRGTRKVILATNIAETSITVPGVRYVVDPGFVKARSFRAKQATESLQVVPVSQAQARQRSGRAGREAAGKAFRLYTEDTFWALSPATPPEIQQVRLTSVVLQLKALGVQDPLRFDFMDAPPQGALLRALEQLYALGALDEDGQLTKPLGESLARLPVEPTMAKVLVVAAGQGGGGYGVAALAVVAMDSTDEVFATSRQKQEEAAAARKQFVHKTGDHMTQAAIYFAFSQVKDDKAKWCAQRGLSLRALKKAADIYSQLAGHLQALDLGLSLDASDLAGTQDEGQDLRRALTAGLFMNAATRQTDGSYRVVVSGQTVHIHPSSVLCSKKPRCIVFGELIRTSRVYARQVSAIDPAWLPELAPSVFLRNLLA